MKSKKMLLTLGLCIAALLVGCGGDDTNEENPNNGNESVIVGEDGQEYALSEYVTLGDYMGMQISVESPVVTNEEVRAYVEESLLPIYPAYIPLDKTVVEEGDSVNIDYEGTRDGVAFDGGTASGQVLTIGSHRFIDGFEDGLIGANVGETRDLYLTFPDPYDRNPDLAGQPVLFRVTVNSIGESGFDAMTDEYVSTNFGSSLGVNTVQELLDMVRSNMENERAASTTTRIRSAAITKLQEICSVEIPEGLLQERFAEYKEFFRTSIREQYGWELSEYFEYAGITEEDFDAQLMEYTVKSNLKYELIFKAIAAKEGIEVDEEDYQSYLSNYAANYGYESVDDLLESEGESNVYTTYVGNLVLDLIVENAVVTYGEPVADTASDAAGNEEAGTE